MTDNSRLSRKDLKGPDEFISTFGEIFAWARENRNRVAGAFAGVLLLAAAVGGTSAWLAMRETQASNELWPHLNRAQEVLQASGPLDENALLALEQALSSYVMRHPKADAAVYAHYYLGSIAYDRGNYDICISQFKSSLALGSDRGILKYLSQLGLAQALEAKGDLASASVAYKEAAGSAPGRLKDHARLGEARTVGLLGRSSDAAAIYRELATSSQDPATKEFAEIRLAGLR